MHKKHRTTAIIIVALVSLSMIGSSFALFFSDTPGTPTATAANSKNSADSQVQSLQSQVDGLNQAVKANPQDPNLHLSLANSYYDLGIAQLNSKQDQAATASLKQATNEYQEVLKSKKDDVNIMVDMATAAFYGGDNTLAETTFKQALAIKPDFLNALLNYGIFLMEAKGDYLGAIAEFNQALSTNPSSTDADRIKGLISTAQAKLNGNAGK
ncbi:tetratricopeptide repeat protein [Desulfitobacterium sp.]|uniref:tetratricopeptide repeat protein n=1 Tax=Desulfitobacterium sp. TaxID=49981 RepID=UPI002C5A7183|nr:tetratricopeptide repeat protein [Desulfitobacterium sp.]HVJ49146.1 tetratricopeptide repeat protein [Desulfitobacterium sp.]